MSDDRDAMLELALTLNVAQAWYEFTQKNLSGTRKALLRAVKETRKHIDRDGANALARLEAGDEDALRYADGVAEEVHTLDEWEVLVRQGDEGTLRAMLIAMKALTQRARSTRIAVEPRPYEFSSLDGEAVLPEERTLLETLRSIALRIQSIYPTMPSHNIVNRVFSDVILPSLPRTLRQDRELCDWIVREVRQSLR